MLRMRSKQGNGRCDYFSHGYSAFGASLCSTKRLFSHSQRPYLVMSLSCPLTVAPSEDQSCHGQRLLAASVRKILLAYLVLNREIAYSYPDLVAATAAMKADPRSLQSLPRSLTLLSQKWIPDEAGNDAEFLMRDGIAPHGDDLFLTLAVASHEL